MFPLVLLLLAGCTYPAQAPGEASVDAWATFDGGASAWQVDGAVAADVALGPGGRWAMHVQSTGPGALSSPDGAAPSDWSNSSALALHVYRDWPTDAAAPTTDFEVRVHTSDGSWFRRDVEPSHAGWASVVMPLPWFRWGGEGPVPRWDRISSVELVVDRATSIWLDEVGLVPGEALPGAEDLSALGVLGDVRVRRDDNLLLVTDATGLDLDQLSDHLARAEAVLRADLPFLGPFSGPPTLVVTADRAEHSALVRAVARAVGADLDQRLTTGFTLLGIATASWSEQYGTLRPVYVHEIVHSMLARAHAMPDQPHEWLQEGLATRVQLAIHPESAPPPGHDRWKNVGRLRPVLDGGGVENHEGGYLVAAATVGMLVEHPRYAPHLGALLAAFNASGSTDLRPQLGPILGVDERTFSADWNAWVADR